MAPWRSVGLSFPDVAGPAFSPPRGRDRRIGAHPRPRRAEHEAMVAQFLAQLG